MNEALPKRAVEPVHPPEVADELDLREYLAIVADSRWLVAGTVALLLAVAALYATFATPTYRSDVLLQVNETTSGLGGLAELRATAMASPMFPGLVALTTAEIIRSRALIGEVVDKLALDVEASPRYFPWVGERIARGRGGGEPAPPLLGLSQYAWGGEHIRVQHLKVPAEWAGRPLSLVASAGGYRLHGPEGEPLLEGRIGERAHADLPGGRGAVELEVAELRAREGTEFTLARVSRGTAIARLQDALRIVEKSKMTGILEMALEGTDPQRLAATLDEIARSCQTHDVLRRSAEAEKTLEFVNSQLPIVKTKLEVAEKALSVFRTESGTVDVPLVTQGALDRSVDVEKQLLELELQRAELRQRFAPSHPALRVLGQQEDQLRRRRASVEALIRGLPETETRSLQLTRDVKVANEMYVLLLNKEQELAVAKSGTLGNVVILDTAVVPKGPVKPKRRLALLEGLLAGLLVGVTLAIVRRRFHPTEQDPDRVEQRLGIPVYATIPHSARQHQLTRPSRRKSTQPQVLALLEPNDPAIESLRSLRTSLQFALLEAPNNLIGIGGPSPSVGKSFVAINLAHVLAAAGKRVLLVDADMHKGYLHRSLCVERSPGLVEVIRAEVPAVKAIQSISPTLSFMPAGSSQANPFELVSGERFRSVAAELSKLFDLVLLDAPPVLSVADAIVIGQVVGVSLLVLRAARHPLGEIALTVKRLEQGGAKPNGFIFNDVGPQSVYRGYGYHYSYHHAYR